MTGRSAAAWVARLAVLAATLATSRAGAENESGAVGISGLPVFGTEAATGDGWLEIVARVENHSATAQSGILELTSTTSWSGSDGTFSARAPFHVAPARSALVRLPAHGVPFYLPTLTLRATGDGGALLASATVTASAAGGPLLVDVASPSRLAPVLRGFPLAAGWDPFDHGASRARTATVGSPMFDNATGDPILPAHAAGYAPATVVLLRSERLAHLDTAALAALTSWVLAGGTLAIVPTRPEDLAAPPLTTLVGGAVTAVAAPAALLGYPAVEKPLPGEEPDAPSDAPDPPFEVDPGVDPEGPTPLRYEPRAPAPRDVVPLSGGNAPARRLGPTSAVRARLAGYAGGKLHPSPFGASTSYGLGEVHLVAFDPGERPMVDDGWVHGRMLAMLDRAWERRAVNVFPHGWGDHRPSAMADVRRVLDPNENFRPALAVAAILLVLYSILAGPITFLRAARLGDPLRPLKWAPVWSAATFLLIVLVGLAGKGWRGRARHLALVEAAADTPQAAIRRFRGFFASRSEALAIAGSDPSCLLDVVSQDGSSSSAGGRGVLRVERDGVTLESLTSLPWQTVVVREDGAFDLDGGIGLTPAAGGDVIVENRTRHAMRDVLIFAPDAGYYFAPSLASGSRIAAKSARYVRGPAGRFTKTAGSRKVHALAVATFETDLGGLDGARFADAWRPLENAAGDAVDWFPDASPVLLAELVGADATSRDAGLNVESNRVMIRIVGAKP